MTILSTLVALLCSVLWSGDNLDKVYVPLHSIKKTSNVITPAYQRQRPQFADKVVPYVCRVRVAHGNGSASLGSGTYVHDGYILTAYHVIQDRGNITVSFPTKGIHTATIVTYNASIDSAVLRISNTNLLPPLEMATSVSPGEHVYPIGYGGDGQLAWAPGQVTKFYQATGTNNPVWFELNNQVRQGDSGGPIFNRTGKLLGNLWGAGRGSTMGCRPGYCLPLIPRRRSPQPQPQPQPPAPIVDVSPPAPIVEDSNCNCDLSKEEIQALQDKIRSLEERVTNLESQPKEGGDPNLPSAKGLIMYFTSVSCNDCKEVDTKIRELISKGYPVTVITLSEKKAQVFGVPRIFIPEKNREVSGIENCKFYLSNLVPR